VCVCVRESNPQAVDFTLQSRKKRAIRSSQWSPTNCTAGHWHHQNVRLELAFRSTNGICRRPVVVGTRVWLTSLPSKKRKLAYIVLCVCVSAVISF